jgi:hypothetical protein
MLKMALEREEGKVFGFDFSKPNRFLKNRSEFFSELQVKATCRNITETSVCDAYDSLTFQIANSAIDSAELVAGRNLKSKIIGGV